MKFDGKNWTVYKASNSDLPDNNIKSLAIDSNGCIWIGTYDSELAEFDGVNLTVYDTTNCGLPINYIHCITIDETGNKWIDSGYFYMEGGGFVKFNGTDWIVCSHINKFRKTRGEYKTYQIDCNSVTGGLYTIKATSEIYKLILVEVVP